MKAKVGGFEQDPTLGGLRWIKGRSVEDQLEE